MQTNICRCFCVVFFFQIFSSLYLFKKKRKEKVKLSFIIFLSHIYFNNIILIRYIRSYILSNKIKSLISNPWKRYNRKKKIIDLIIYMHRVMICLGKWYLISFHIHIYIFEYCLKTNKFFINRGEVNYFQGLIYLYIFIFLQFSLFVLKG